MDHLDRRILSVLVEDGRASFADLGRAVGISRGQARERVQRLVGEGVIEQFSVIINPEKINTGFSTFVDLCVHAQHIEAVADELARCQEVVSLYVMSDLKSLHIHTLTEDSDEFLRFAKQHFFGRPEILSVDSKNLLRRIKNRRGGVRL